MLDANQIAAMEKAMDEEHRRDREALQRLKRFLPTGSSGSNGHDAPIVIDRSGETEARPWEDIDFVEADPETIIGRVETIMMSDPEKRWTVPSMVAHLKTIGFPLEAKKPQATMGLVFAKLRKRHKIRLVRRGSGRNPNTYRGEQAITSENAPQNERAAS